MFNAPALKHTSSPLLLGLITPATLLDVIEAYALSR